MQSTSDAPDAWDAWPSGQSPADGGLRTLVVDDNRDAADTMAGVLRLLGRDARAAYDGEQAVALAQSFQPDLVLLDLNMPGGDGFSVLQRLRALPGVPAMFVAAVTGYDSADDRAQTSAAGFDAHLRKPVDIEQLRQVMANAKARGG